MAEGFSGAYPGRSYGTITSYNEPLPNVSVAGQGQATSQVPSLCENITTNIYTINSSWKQLQQAIKVIGTNKDNQGVRDRVHVAQLSTNEIIAQTTQEFQKLTALVRRAPGDKQQKLQVDRLTNLFKEAVQTYSSVQKQVADKIKFCLLPSEAAILSESQDQLINVEEDQKQITANRQSIKDLEFEQSLYKERELLVKKIEDDIIDVNQIMRELGALVHKDNEPIDLIVRQTEDAHANVGASEDQLKQAQAHLYKRRRRTFYLLTIAMIAMLVVALVIYFAVK